MNMHTCRSQYLDRGVVSLDGQRLQSLAKDHFLSLVILAAPISEASQNLTGFGASAVKLAVFRLQSVQST